ncbi:hypothetical protein EV361DRAFT_1019676 [Lentinula raphanica]|nr:hypothetical protein EV361DRAFT_1019676 [Lentinula raphanica]
MSLVQHNSCQMYKFNQTSTFLRNLSPEMRQWLRKITREQDGSGANRQKKLDLAEFWKDVADTRVEKQRVQNEKRQAAIQAIDNINPILTLTAFDYSASLPPGSKEYLTVAEITKQLKWHKKNGNKGSVPLTESSWGKREDKLKLLRSAIEDYIASGNVGPVVEEEGEHVEDIPDIRTQDLEVFQEDGYDSEDDYYRQ